MYIYIVYYIIIEKLEPAAIACAPHPPMFVSSTH